MRETTSRIDRKGTPWEFTMSDVLSLVSPTLKSGKPSRKGEIEVLCPRGVKSKNGRTACLGVNLQSQGFKCFNECSDCINHGGMLDLYNLFTGRSCEDKRGAKREILERLGKGERKTQQREIWLPDYSVRKQQQDLASPEILDKTYRAFLDSLDLNETHKANLISRGLSEEAIQKGLYRSIPRDKGAWGRILSRLRKEGVNFDGVPGFYRENGKVHTTAKREGFFIPYFNQDGMLCGLQIRYDTKPGNSKTRYMWFSSNGYENGCAASNIMSWGIPGHMPAVDGSSVVYATEGALKSYIAHELDGKHHPFVAIAGVSCFGAWNDACTVMEQRGIDFVVDAFDADRDENPRVQRSIQKLYEIAASHGIRMRRFNWGNQEKGIDDYLLSVRKHNLARIEEGREESIVLTPPRKFTPPAHRAPARKPMNNR